MFKAGDEVICIDDTDLSEKELKKGDEYTISTVDSKGYKCAYTGKHITVLILIGFPNDPFHSNRFRKKQKNRFTNKLTKKLANKPIVKETVEKIEELQIV